MTGSAATVKQLRDRWKQSPWMERNAALREWFAGRIGYVGPLRDKSDDLDGFLEGLPFRDEVPSGVDLRGSSVDGMRRVAFEGLDASHCGALAPVQSSFVECRFVKTGPWHDVWGSFRRCVFTSARMQRVSFVGGPITDCNLDSANLLRAKALRVDFRGSTFRGANLRRVELGECDLRGCDFTDADLTDALLTGSVIDETTIFHGARLISVTTDQDWGPPERQSRLDLTIGQFDERTIFEKPQEKPPASFWHAWLSAIMHHLPQWKDKRWAPVIRDIVEHKRQSLRGKPPDDAEKWALEIVEAVDPADRMEVEAFLEDAATKGM